VKSEEVDVSRTILVNGVPYEQLVERNGRPPSAEEERKQKETLPRQVGKLFSKVATMEQMRVDDGIWMPVRVEVPAAAKIFFVKSLVVERVLTYSEYRLAETGVPTKRAPCSHEHGSLNDALTRKKTTIFLRVAPGGKMQIRCVSWVRYRSRLECVVNKSSCPVLLIRDLSAL